MKRFLARRLTWKSGFDVGAAESVQTSLGSVLMVRLKSGRCSWSYSLRPKACKLTHDKHDDDDTLFADHGRDFSVRWWFLAACNPLLGVICLDGCLRERRFVGCAGLKRAGVLPCQPEFLSIRNPNLAGDAIMADSITPRKRVKVARRIDAMSLASSPNDASRGQVRGAPQVFR